MSKRDGRDREGEEWDAFSYLPELCVVLNLHDRHQDTGCHTYTVSGARELALALNELADELNPRDEEREPCDGKPACGLFGCEACHPTEHPDRD